MSSNTLRRLKPLERDIQAGVLELLRLMPEVAWAHKVWVGSGILVRPIEGVSVRKELEVCGFKPHRLSFIQGAPEGTLDIALQLSGIGTHCELEVKKPSEKLTEAQRARMTNVWANGGLADWVDDIDQVQPLINSWRNGRA